MDARITSIGSIALRMALGYAVFGCVWILGSDHVVAILFQDPASLTIVQSWKGLFFVLLSSVLIFAMGAFFMRALAASEYRYRSLFADSPEALVIYDLDSLLIVDANAAVGRLLGHDSTAMIDRLVSDFMPQPTTDALTRSLPRLRELSQSTAVWRLRHQDGRELDISIHGQTYLEKGRRLRQVLLIDITARVRAETELLRTLDELASTNERMRELGHAISHDLQEPLRQITSFVQLLERRYADRLDAEATQFIGYAVEGVARLKTLLADVEDFTVHTGPQPESVAANAVIDTVLNDLERSIDGAHAQVAVGDCPGFWPIRAVWRWFSIRCWIMPSNSAAPMFRAKSSSAPPTRAGIGFSGFRTTASASSRNSELRYFRCFAACTRANAFPAMAPVWPWPRKWWNPGAGASGSRPRLAAVQSSPSPYRGRMPEPEDSAGNINRPLSLTDAPLGSICLAVAKGPAPRVRP